MRRAWVLLVLSALLLSGCSTKHRTAQALETTPVPEGWLTYETKEVERASGAPDIAILATYGPERTGTDLTTDLFRGLDAAGWTTQVVYGEGIGQGDWGQLTGRRGEDQNQPTYLSCEVDPTRGARDAGEPLALDCRLSIHAN